ncbi:hypothetical protein ACFX13_021805 [Malus domestica]|uniref:DUF7733 domain-containing protein n=1 Tax=Malus domestica TaxID=3750 RepID=A0A498HJG9_MALDO|nr:uncharacterized protein LOC103403187 [Malus domestica]XP_017179287.2 uncharacterized protein LOC103403187 [Malus domestica]XP_028951682.1 uncharacterized protein LOC103403187 [Malus domestica]RXH71616.1 hypothetical protein DVH24_025117 [Malus domestica]
MSGVSLAVAPRSEPDTTTTTTTPGSKPQEKPLHRQQHQQPAVGGVMGSLRVIELQLVAFIMVFSVSGLVPLFDLIFPAFASAYLLALARLAFPSHGPVSSSSREIFQGSRFFRFYVVVGTTIGLFLPLAYVLGGFARGDEHAVRSATPHLFLLSFQILTENVISGLSLFSPPVRALVPLLYTVRRICVILDWMKDVWLNKTLPANAQFKDVAWFWFGRSLAIANFIYFSINLFGFLIPRFLPRAFERYFRERDEVESKMVEDKRSAAASKLEPVADKKSH